jgi:hypothetical protein
MSKRYPLKNLVTLLTGEEVRKFIPLGPVVRMALSSIQENTALINDFVLPLQVSDGLEDRGDHDLSIFT